MDIAISRIGSIIDSDKVAAVTGYGAIRRNTRLRARKHQDGNT